MKLAFNPIILGLASVVLSGCSLLGPTQLQPVTNAMPLLPEGVYETSQVDTQPVVVSRAFPVYPPELRADEINGSATIVFTIAADGKFTDPVILQATDVRFGQSAIDCFERWRFKPAKIGSKPVACRMTYPIDFTLTK